MTRTADLVDAVGRSDVDTEQTEDGLVGGVDDLDDVLGTGAVDRAEPHGEAREQVDAAIPGGIEDGVDGGGLRVAVVHPERALDVRQIERSADHECVPLV